MRALPNTSVSFRTPSGVVVAHVIVVAVKNAESASTAPLARAVVPTIAVVAPVTVTAAPP